MKGEGSFDRTIYEELLREYRERFGEGIPYHMPPKDEERIIEILEECLRSGKAYEPPPVPEGCIA